MQPTNFELSKYSLGRAIHGLATRKVDQLSAVISEDLEKTGLVRTLNHSLMVPYEVLCRDLNTSTASAGGYLAATDRAPVIELFRPVSVIAQAGATIISGFKADVTLPRESAESIGYWLATETTAVPLSGPTFGSIAAKPKTCGATIKFSRQLDMTAEGFSNIISNSLRKTIGAIIDAAALNGTGALGQPLGLLNSPGFGVQSGTSLAWASITNMKKLVSDSNGTASAFVATPAVKKLLEDREKATGSGRFIWEDDKVSSTLAFASNTLPAGTLIAGDFSNMMILFWGQGFELAVDPFTDFKSGQITMRILVSVDIVIQRPNQFVVSSAVT